jgi:hypothetical protein
MQATRTRKGDGLLFDRPASSRSASWVLKPVPSSAEPNTYCRYCRSRFTLPYGATETPTTSVGTQATLCLLVLRRIGPEVVAGGGVHLVGGGQAALDVLGLLRVERDADGAAGECRGRRISIAKPRSVSSAARRRRLLEVQRRGDCGSPRVQGSRSFSSSSLRRGNFSVMGLLPPPGRRIRALRAGADGAFWTSRIPACTVR